MRMDGDRSCEYQLLLGMVTQDVFLSPSHFTSGVFVVVSEFTGCRLCRRAPKLEESNINS